MQDRVSVPFSKAWWPAPVTLVSCGVQAPHPKATQRGANIWAVGVLGGPCDDPPILTISPRTAMYSYGLIREVGQFVVNVPTPQMVREMEYCGTHTGLEVNKWTACGFTPVKGTIVDVPLIAECPVAFECVVEREIAFERADGSAGEHVMICGRTVQVNAHACCFIDGQLQWDLIDTIFRSRPRSWRILGPVVGFDARKGPLAKPLEAASLVETRVRSYEGLADIIRRTPYPTQQAEE